MQGYAVGLVLKADGSLEFQGVAGTWRAQGNRLYLTEGEETVAYEYRLQGSQLELAGGDLTAPVVLTRAGGGTPSVVRLGTSAAQPGSAATRAPGRERGLSQAEVMDLLDGGVAGSRIAALVEERGISFAMTPSLAAQLRGKGASAELIDVLNRAGNKSAATGGAEVSPARRRAATLATSTGTGIFVNEVELTPQEVQQLQAMYGGVGQPGHFWYDRMNGSWGRQGGPTEGFIVAGLNLGGPLREDASNGDTGVFINGRQLHRVDVQRLSLLGPVHPGRCWMDAQGYIGLEGQPAFANIFTAARALSGGGSRKEGILSTYDKTGVAVFGH